MTCRRTRPTRRALGTLGFLLLLPGLAIPLTARGDEPPTVVLSGESRATAIRLNEARKRFEERKWPETIEALQGILNTAGNDLVALTPTHSVQARRLCQIQLATLPPEALRLYRQRYETQAQKGLEQARASHDAGGLRKVVDEAFCTRAAEKALDLLGDLAFERGRFDEAEEWWRLLVPLPDARRDRAIRGLALVYPDPTLDPARVQAKQMLARLFRGGSAWSGELERYRARYEKGEGALAGRKGRYADLLQALAEERKQAATAADLDWSTFGGDPSRGRVIPAPADILDRLSALCRAGPTWRFNLQERARQEGPSPPSAANSAQARKFAFHPVIVGHQVLLADAQYVTAYDLRTGQSSEWYNVGDKNGGVNPNLKLPAPADLGYTLTVDGDHVFVRLGAQDIGMELPPMGPPLIGGKAKPQREQETFLACLSLRPDAEGKHCRWCIPGINRIRDALFEGAPLAAGGQVCIASTRYNGDRCISSIDCYPAEQASGPPPRWQRDVCETRGLKAGEPRYRHHLLTLAGTQIVYCSHMGAVVAVDAATGRTNWAVRYPRQADAKNDGFQPVSTNWKDLAPALFAAGRLYVAPADSDRLLCLDPLTGRTLWEREAMKVVHLLGVGQERLIFTTCDGLRAVGAADGSDAAGWLVPHGGGALEPMGRGLLIGDLVLWPTARHDNFSPAIKTVVYAVRQRDGRPADDPTLLHRLPAGNLAYANGCLAVADQHTLSVFVAPGLRLPQRKDQARRRPDSVPVLIELGRAESDAGQTAQALQTFLQAETKARELPVSGQRRRLLEQARAGRQQVLLEMAQRAATAKRWEDAATAFRKAAAVELPARARLHALLRAAQIWQEAGQTDRALAVWESIRADNALRPIQVIDPSGTPASAAASAATAIARLRGQRVVPARPRPPPRIAPAHDPPALPLSRGWHVRLGDEEWLLSGPWGDEGDLLSGVGPPRQRLICRSTRDGAVRWRHRLPFAPRWAGCHADTILAAGDGGVACLRRDDGEVLWHFPAPAAALYPSSLDGVRVVRDPQAPEPLTAFQAVAGRLFVLQGQRRLFALDAQTGEVLWDRWAPDAGLRLPYPQSRFSTCYFASAKALLIQTSGQRWLLDAATGRLIHHAPTGSGLWQRPPLVLDERTLCVLSHACRVALVDALSGQEQWTHEPTAWSTLSGEVPQVLGRGDVILLVMPANIGCFLQRLDRNTGKALWSKPRLLTTKSLDTANWTFDQQTVYYVEDRSLTACSLADGRVLWKRTLGGVCAWQVRRVGDYLAVHPIASDGEWRFRFRSPLGSVQWDVSSLLAPGTTFAVMFCDPKTGQTVQRLNFRIASPARTSYGRRRTPEDHGGSWLVQTSSLLASEEGPTVRFTNPAFVAVGGEVWGLTRMGG